MTIFEPEISRHEHHSARSRNLVAISPTTPTWEASMGKHQSMDWAARDTAAQKEDNRVATSVCRATAKCIPSCRGGLRQNTSYEHTQHRTLDAQKSKLVNQALTLFLNRYPSSFGRGHFGRQARNFLLGHVPSSAHSHELAF
jgi:hypothetical protein